MADNNSTNPGRHEGNEKQAGLNARLSFFAQLLSEGYSDKVREFTRSIRYSPDAVKEFVSALNLLAANDLIYWEDVPSQERLEDKTEESLLEMAQFLKGIGRPFQSYFLLIMHGTEATFEIGWLDKMAGQVMWDQWTEEVDDAVIAFSEAGIIFDVSNYVCAPKAAKKPEPPLYRYHPERFKAYRDYACEVGRYFQRNVDSESGMMTADQLQSVMAIVSEEMSERARLVPRKLKFACPHPSFVMNAELTLATAYGRFFQAGRQIIDFPQQMTDLLGDSDIDDIPLNAIKMPYASQYLYFGPQEDMEIEPGWIVDGAYVEQRGEAGDIRFTITAAPRDHARSAEWCTFPEVQYTQDFVGEFRSMDLATAIDTVLSSRLAVLAEQKSQKGGDITAQVEAQPFVYGRTMPAGIQIVDVAPQMASLRDDETRRRHPVYKKALQIVVNALCYVTAYPDDIETAWPDGTPASLLGKANSGTSKERARAQSKLASLGYSPVNLCGKHFEEEVKRAGIDPGAIKKGSVAMHWRRGHWRRQAHGTGLSLRKMVWVMPTMVNKKNNKSDGPELGHIYLVS